MTELEPQSRFVVGIDLGTTNSAMAFFDTTKSPWRVETFGVIQWVDAGQYEQRDTLPSFHYELTHDDAQSTSWRLPWETHHSKSARRSVVGVFARDAGQRHPGRRIASAKSWLAHDGVDRSADFLPWHGDADVSRMSPVDVSASYLQHLRSAWDHAHPDEPLANQDVVVTLPASFDEVARELTIRAAKLAGLQRVYLIEEPQAAFYAWIDSQGEQWSSRIAAGQLILVCDIGGGTTDFTLIRVQPAGIDSQQVQFHRVAVGKHLILGGDNLDLAIAKLAEAKLLAEPAAASLTADAWDRLVQAARVCKETMLSDVRPPQYTLSLPSEGSRLIGGAVQVTLAAAEIDTTIIDGFFPVVPLDQRPAAGQSGFREFGLPYASDPAVTRHLAAFLSDHRRSGLSGDDHSSSDRPAWLLFNGGVMASAALRDRITDSLSRWFTQSRETTWRPELLASSRLDLAVARGAAYFAMVRRGEGVKIAANLGRAYYMQVTTDPPQAICLIPGNAETGQRFQTNEHPLELQLGQPVQFPLWSSSTRLADRAGELVAITAGEATRLPPIFTALSNGKRRSDQVIRVAIQSELSEIGTVGLWCVDLDTGKRWQLDFDIRSTLETDRVAHDASGEAAGIVDEQTVVTCQSIIQQTFASAQGIKPSELVSRLQVATEMKRDAWPPSLLRKLSHTLIDSNDSRSLSPQHEARWLNLAGYCLRPGYGVAVDDWRVAVTWKAVFGKIVFSAPQSRAESLILWRRIAGGMTSGQQQQLADPIINQLKLKSLRIENQERAELWRLIGSLERISASLKIDLAEIAISELVRKKAEPIRPALLWAIGRIGNRQPVYGPLNTVVAAAQAERWIDDLRATEIEGKAMENAVVQLARLTGDRFRDLSGPGRYAAINWLERLGATTHSIELVRDGGSLNRDEEATLFGESLPLGIRISRNG